MPVHKTHITVAKKDGFDVETMQYYNKIIDIFHQKKSRDEGMSPGKAEAYELGLLDKLIDVVSGFPEPDEPKEGLKVICHHYALDFLKKKGYEHFLTIAKIEGLKGVHSFLIDQENSVHIEKIARNRIPDPVSARNKNLLYNFAEDMLEDLKNVIGKWHEVYRAENLEDAEELARRFADVIKKAKGIFTGYSPTEAGYRAWISAGHRGTFEEFMKLHGRSNG